MLELVEDYACLICPDNDNSSQRKRLKTNLMDEGVPLVWPETIDVMLNECGWSPSRGLIVLSQSRIIPDSSIKEKLNYFDFRMMTNEELDAMLEKIRETQKKIL